MSDVQSPRLQAVATRLGDEHAEVVRCERRLKGARRRRALLVLKLITGGWTERRIAQPLGVTGTHIHLWKRQAQRERDAADA